MTPKEQALYCASLGYPVIAGYPAGKSERAIVKGTAEGTLNTEIIERLFDEIPNRNIHISLKNSHLICIDLDKHGAYQDGVQAFNALWSEHEDEPVQTYVEQTPTGGGFHIFFKVPADLFSNKIVRELADGVEIKTHFTAIYPSKREKGDYIPLTNENGELLTLSDVTDCPEWLLKLLPDKGQKKTSYSSYSRTYGAEMWELFNQGANKGNRNNDTNKILHYWRKIGIEPASCMDLLQAFNNRTSPPLEDNELATIWKSVYKMK